MGYELWVVGYEWFDEIASLVRYARVLLGLNDRGCELWVMNDGGNRESSQSSKLIAHGITNIFQILEC